MEPLWAIILDIWKDEPIYHLKDYGRKLSPGVIAPRTICGREIGLGKPFLPMKHAKKFSRPCKGCFPSGRHE